MRGAWPSVVSTRAPISDSGSATQRLVAHELEAPLLAREDARQEPHERACIPAVDRPVRRTQTAEPDTAHARLVAVELDSRAQHLDGACRGERVFRQAKALEQALPLCNRPEQKSPVRDGLVAGNGEVTAQRDRRLDLEDTHE